MSKVSVILPCHSFDAAEKFLSKFNAQTSPDFDVVLLYDKDTADSKLFTLGNLNEFKYKIKFVPVKNARGKTYADIPNLRVYIQAINNAYGKYILLASENVYYENNYIEKLLETVEAEKSEVCFSPMAVDWPDGICTLYDSDLDITSTDFYYNKSKCDELISLSSIRWWIHYFENKVILRTFFKRCLKELDYFFSKNTAHLDLESLILVSCLLSLHPRISYTNVSYAKLDWKTQDLQIRGFFSRNETEFFVNETIQVLKFVNSKLKTNLKMSDVNVSNFDENLIKRIIWRYEWATSNLAEKMTEVFGMNFERFSLDEIGKCGRNLTIPKTVNDTSSEAAETPEQIDLESHVLNQTEEIEENPAVQNEERNEEPALKQTAKPYHDKENTSETDYAADKDTVKSESNEAKQEDVSPSNNDAETDNGSSKESHSDTENNLQKVNYFNVNQKLFEFLSRNLDYDRNAREVEICLNPSDNLLFYKDSSEQLSKEYGSNLKFKFEFKGRITFKIGMFKEGYSYQWLFERSLENDSYGSKELEVSFSGEILGLIEFFIISESETCFRVDNYEILTPTEIESSSVIENFLFPTISLCSEIELYFHLNGQGQIKHSVHQVELYPGAILDLGTYFNSFISTKWSSYTNVENLGLFLEIAGLCEVEILSNNEDSTTIIKKFLVNSSERSTYSYNFKSPTEGIVSVKINALSKVTFFGGGFYTTDPKNHEYKLGIGITTFRREKEVVSAVNRLVQDISNNKLYADKIDVTVVDNGSTLKCQDVNGANLITNANLGGSGGFMRNLIHYKEAGGYTHVLFMDDDAFCETESIFRSLCILEHSKIENAAVSGAMLSKNIMFEQWENGAYFDVRCNPLHCHLDLRNMKNLLENELESPYQTYGAWWFFMFPISAVTKLSFPFFVRGDDVEFSYHNDFKIIRMNGIGTWQEDFKTKEGPLTWYLDLRSHLIHHLLLNNCNYKLHDSVKMMNDFFSRFNNSYHYDSALMVNKAIVDVIKGPKYFEKNKDCSLTRSYVKKHCKIEVKKKLRSDYKNIPYLNGVFTPGSSPNILATLDFHGHLIPLSYLYQNIKKVNKFDTPNPDLVYKRKKILVISLTDNTEYILQRNVCHYFKNYFYFIVLKLLYKILYPILKFKYKKYFNDNFSNSNKWNSLFKKL